MRWFGRSSPTWIVLVPEWRSPTRTMPGDPAVGERKVWGLTFVREGGALMPDRERNVNRNPRKSAPGRRIRRDRTTECVDRVTEATAVLSCGTSRGDCGAC